MFTCTYQGYDDVQIEVDAHHESVWTHAGPSTLYRPPRGKATVMIAAQFWVVLIVLFFVDETKRLLHGQTVRGVDVGFPEAWNADDFHKELCLSRNIPEWLDGYFLIQTSAAYGKRSDPVGKKLTHMFDGLGAVACLELWNGQVKFSAKYYPARPYKIWNFYDRDMSQSKVAWDPIRSPFNASANEMWMQIKDDYSFPMHPNIDFWQVGRTVIGATEFVGVGLQFDVNSLNDFKPFQFKETDNIFIGASTIIPLTMPVHERMERDGTIYAGLTAFEPSKHRMYQIVFKVRPDGVRTLEGMFDHGPYEPEKCTSDGRYTGNKKILAGYMHSITSTKHYVILPITSYILNPCKLPPIVDHLPNVVGNSNSSSDIREHPIATEFSAEVPLRFLIFDKMSKTFVSQKPFEVYPATFITHQFNAYEDDDGILVADMIGTEGNESMYDFLTPDFIINRGFGQPFIRLSRYQFNLRTGTVQRSHMLLEQQKMSAEFPTYNRNFMERKYKFGYIIVNPFMAGSKIVKIDMDIRRIVGEFKAPGTRSMVSVLREPWFVQRPGSIEEDDGALLVLGGDVITKSTVLYVVDAKSMRLYGQSEIPTFIPFGFHNRFYNRYDINNLIPQQGVNAGSPGSNHNSGTSGLVVDSGALNQLVKAVSGMGPGTDNILWSQQNLPEVPPTIHQQQVSNNFIQEQTESFQHPPTPTVANVPSTQTNPQTPQIIYPSTMFTFNNKRGNIAEDNFGLPTTSLSNLNWANVVDQGKKLICSLFKDAIDKSGSRFCTNSDLERRRYK